MVTPSVGAIILVTFPFSDLSQAKLRPAVVLADVGRNDWILCQITSNPYGDSKAITLTDNSFAQGSLPVTSYARPALLGTVRKNVKTPLTALNEEVLVTTFALLRTVPIFIFPFSLPFSFSHHFFRAG